MDTKDSEYSGETADFHQVESSSPPAAALGQVTVDIPAVIAAGRAFLATLAGVQDFALIGSAMYLPGAQDVDFAVRLAPGMDAVSYSSALAISGWGNCGEYDGVGGIWAAVRRDSLNLMITHDAAFYKGYLTAMQVCKALGLRRKHERVAVCQIVRDGKSAEEAWGFWAPWQKAETTGEARAAA